MEEICVTEKMKKLWWRRLSKGGSIEVNLQIFENKGVEIAK